MVERQLCGWSAFALVGRLLALFLLLSGCTADLTKAYDAALIRGLNDANEETLVLFSEISNGATAGRYAELAPKFDGLIGKFEALRMQSAARPVPALGLRIGGKLPGCGNAGECLTVSDQTLDEIVGNLKGLKDDIREAGLTAMAVDLGKRDYQTAIGQVLAIENALGS